MSRIGKKLKVALEELNIEKAIDEANNQPNENSVDGIINSLEENIENKDLNTVSDEDTGLPDIETNTSSDTPAEPVEADTSSEDSDTNTEEDTEAEEEVKLDSPKGDLAADKAEEASDKVEEANKAIEALEAISEILSQANEIGGLNPQSANMVKMATDAITSPIGISVEDIDSEKLNSYSQRTKITSDTINKIKEASKKIFAKIIELIKKMMSFVNEAYRFYNSELMTVRDKFDKIKNIHKGSLKTEPNEEHIKGIVANAILKDKAYESSDVVETAELTHQVLLNFINNYNKDLTNAVATIEEFKEKSFNIDLEGSEDTTQRATVKSLSQYGQFFGTHITSFMKQVKDIDGVTKPSNTISCFESPTIAGAVKIIAFVPNRINVVGSDILNSKITFKPPSEDLEYSSGVAVCEHSDFRKLFSIVDKMFLLNRRIGEAINSSNRENSKLLDYVASMDRVITKGLSKPLENAGYETNQSHGPKMMNDLIRSVKSCYIDSIKSNLTYSSRYIKALVTYIDLSTKQYA